MNKDFLALQFQSEHDDGCYELVLVGILPVTASPEDIRAAVSADCRSERVLEGLELETPQVSFKPGATYGEATVGISGRKQRFFYEIHETHLLCPGGEEE